MKDSLQQLQDIFAEAVRLNVAGHELQVLELLIEMAEIAKMHVRFERPHHDLSFKMFRFTRELLDQMVVAIRFIQEGKLERARIRIAYFARASCIDFPDEFTGEPIHYPCFEPLKTMIDEPDLKRAEIFLEGLVDEFKKAFDRWPSKGE